MDLRRNLLANVWLQLGLVLTILVLGNTLAARHFGRLDLTEDHLYSLDPATRALLGRLERPLSVKVYFTKNLEYPYNNHERILLDKLEDMRAYSHGWMDVSTADPADRPDLEGEAESFGINPIPYLYTGPERKELKQVYMGLVLIYGDRQQALPTVTNTDALEYELARALKNLVSTEDRKVIGFSAGAGEPDPVATTGALSTLTGQIRQRYNLGRVPLGGAGLIPEEVDAMLVVAPQRPLSARALYQLDQFRMRGGAVGFFVGNITPDLRSLTPQNVLHGLEPFLAQAGVQLNRDLVLDRQHNDPLTLPVRQGEGVANRAFPFPLLPHATVLATDHVAARGLSKLSFWFPSSLTLSDPLPPELHAEVLAASDPGSSRVRGLRSINPYTLQEPLPGEEVGSFPLLVALSGSWESYFAGKQAPPAPPDAPLDPSAAPDDPSKRLQRSEPTRLLVAGSAGLVTRNVPFMLNLIDWMVADEDLISMRAKAVVLPELKAPTPDEAIWIKVVNLGFGSAMLWLVGGLRYLSRRRTAGARELPPSTPAGEGAAP